MLLHEMELDDLKKLFDYDGKNLIWKDRDSESFHSINSAARWRGKNLGKIAGAIDSHSGYRLITYKKRTSLAHRVVWVFIHGSIKKNDFIDHIDGDKTNNDINNLRLCNNAENQHNSKLCKRNTSGYKGVSFNKNNGRWHAALKVFGETKCKTFSKKDDAINFIRIERELMHKKFANNGSGSVLLTKDLQL